VGNFGERATDLNETSRFLSFLSIDYRRIGAFFHVSLYIIFDITYSFNRKEKKRLKFAKIIAIIICSLITFSAISIVTAGTAQSANAWGSIDEKGSVVSSVTIGTTVSIFWNCYPKTSTVDIWVTYQANLDADEVPVIDASWTGLGIDLNGSKSFNADQYGYYYIYCQGGIKSKITVSSVFSAPESVFGALSAVGAGVAAFGAFAVIKKRKSSILPF
jgi:hypothetical protein